MTRSCLAVSLLGALAALALASTPVAVAQQTRAEAEKDPVLKAMLAEMDRNREQLQLKGFEKPFFIQYRIEDIEDYQTKADFGSSWAARRASSRAA